MDALLDGALGPVAVFAAFALLAWLFGRDSRPGFDRRELRHEGEKTPTLRQL